LRVQICEYDIRREAYEFRRISTGALEISATRAVLDPDAGPTKLAQTLPKCRNQNLSLGILFVERPQGRDTPNPVALLRAGRERPRHGRTGEQRDEFTSLH
jgi:hypothetical protein